MIIDLLLSTMIFEDSKSLQLFILQKMIIHMVFLWDHIR